MSEKSRLVTFFLCMCVGMFGGHRFYVGKTGTAILWLFTFGVFGIGYLVDLIMIILGDFYDRGGNKVVVWMKACDSEGKVLHYMV
ncbi:MAG: TM2 domain-containing protein [Acidobacteriota bacterium]|nr:TM2 domain-containing protein [Acidobacteriota bacterium]